MASSEQFVRIYRTLPQECQQAFVEEHLAPLLDTLSTKKRARIIRAAKRSQTRCDGVPKLNLKGKKHEIQTLLAMLAKDDKVAFTRERSNREEILQEVIHSLSSWMNKIWVTAYEYKVNYDQAHECLLYALRSLAMLEDSPGLGDCKCLYKNMHVAITLKDVERRTMRYFSFVGPHRLDEVFLWIWRDLFLTMLMEDHNSKGRVREMLDDIENIMGWQGLERVLRGGSRKSPLDDGDDDDDYDDDDLLDEEEDMLRDYEEIYTDNEFDSDDDTDDGYSCRFHHAKYWPEEINEEKLTLRGIVKSRLIDIFRDAPAPDLFAVINVISQDPTTRTTKQLLQILSDVAGDSAESFRVALIIHTSLYHPWKILKLLESHYDYLRPSDHPILVAAVAILTSSSYRPEALKFIERELFDAVQQFYVAIRSVFSHFAEEPNKTDLVEILKLPLNSPPRKTRIEGWVDRSLTPTREPVGPMAFAAMMMGLPVGPPPSSVEEADFLAYVDFSKPDPDLDDLRDEFRPPLKSRFEQWSRYAQSSARDYPQLLHRVYAKIIEIMPFFKASDVVNAMMTRILDRPSKTHVHEAMSSFLDFCKDYREKQLKKRHPNLKKTKQRSSNNSSPHQAPTADPAINPTPVGGNPSSAGGGTSATFGPPPPSPPPAAGPIFHVFSTPLGNSGGTTTTSFFGFQGNNPPPTTNNPPAPAPGGTNLPFVPPAPPPECTHQ